MYKLLSLWWVPLMKIGDYCRDCSPIERWIGYLGHPAVPMRDWNTFWITTIRYSFLSINIVILRTRSCWPFLVEFLVTSRITNDFYGIWWWMKRLPVIWKRNRLCFWLRRTGAIDHNWNNALHVNSQRLMVDHQMQIETALNILTVPTV